MLAAALIWLACRHGPKEPEAPVWPADMCDCWLDTDSGVENDDDYRYAEECEPMDPVGCTDCDCDRFTAAEGDCDDHHAGVYPGADECPDGCGESDLGVCTEADGIDNDCDGLVDEDYPSVEECDGLDNDCDGKVDEGVTTTLYADVDGDGYGDDGWTTEACTADAGWVAIGGDCDDGDPAVSPAAEEVADGIDNDCDGVVDG